MPTYYMRIEAVNFDNSVYDTHDISTIRGGSFMLLDEVGSLKGRFGLEDVGSAASVGLFKFEAANSTVAESIQKQALAALRKTTGEFATYVGAFALTGDPKDFSRVVQELLAKCRWQQYQQPTIILPAVGATAQACDLDGVRPAVATTQKGSETLNVSQAVFDRREGREDREGGKELRRKIYQELLGVSHLKVTEDLDSLATRQDGGPLDGKIAFIHIDGNRFGRIREAMCKHENDLIDFQNLIQEKLRKPALRAILQKAQADLTPKGEIRLETLLWGGDEIEWVVPAWRAWHVLETFFKTTANIRFKNIPLTHAAGVVFCHHNLPILQVRRYAEKLCDLAKEKVPQKIEDLGENASGFAFLNMTSFDQVTRRVKDFLEIYHEPAKAVDFIVPAAELVNPSPNLKTHLSTIKRFFPKNKLHDIILAVKTGKTKDQVKEIANRALDMLGNNKQATHAALQALAGENFERLERWYLASDLWDYIVEDEHASAI